MLKKLFLMLVLGALMTSVSYAQTASPVVSANEEAAVDNAKAKPTHKAKGSKKKKKKHNVSKKESAAEKK